MWIALLLSPLVSFLVAPVIIAIFAALDALDGGLSEHSNSMGGIIFLWMLVIPLGYPFVLLVLAPARWLLVRFGRFSILGLGVIGCLLGVVLASVFGAIEDAKSFSVWFMLSLSTALIFGYLTSSVEAPPSDT